MRIGIFAGTFDPVHDGHIAFAENAIREAELDQVIIVAEKEPYRKKPHAPWDHRQAMIERATEGINKVDHNYQFAAELSHQHTMVDMLGCAKKHYGKDNEFWFLVGSDIFEHIHKWQNVVSKEEYGGFVVALRGNHTKQWVLEKSSSANFSSNQLAIITNSYPRISSSEIRESTANSNQPIKNIAASVNDYIAQHNLYL